MDTVNPLFASRLRQLRQQAGLSLRGLAAKVPCSHVHIHELEHGRKAPSPQMVARLDEVLGTNGELSALPHRSDPATAELVERLRLGDVSPHTIESLHATVEDLCCAYRWQDASALRAEGQRWLRKVGALLRRPVGLRARAELLTVAGWLALLIGCLEYDLGMRQPAEATRRAAAQLAAEAGNHEIGGWAWEMAAWFTLTQGCYRDVLTAAQAGQQLLGKHLAAVQLVAQEAKAWARIGDRNQVHRTLERGRWLLDRFPRPHRPEHHFQMDPDKWDFYAMDAYRLVGDDERARHHAEQVLILGTAPDGSECAPMRMAEARLTLSTVAARAGAWDDAVTIALTAFQARRRSLPSLLMVAGEVDRELQRRAPRGRPVTELRDALHEVSKELPRRSQD